MNQSLKVTNIKNELTDLTSSDQGEILSQMQLYLIKQNNDCSVQSEIHIKIEPQEDERKSPVTESTAFEMCPNYDIKWETEEPLIKSEYEGMIDELLQDPLNIDSEIKEDHFPFIDLDQSKSGMKIEPIEGKNEEHILESDKDNLHGSGSNPGEDQVLVRNGPNHKDKKYVCSECNKFFTQKSSLNRHLRIHTGAMSFTCIICKKLFNEKSNLDRHMFIHSGEKPYICDVCKKVFRDKSNLIKHKLIHSGEKPFSCDECYQSFAHKHHLVQHQRMHTGEKPFTCDVCEKAFTVKSHLTEHRRLHTGEKPYSCNICNKSFTQKSTFNDHKKIHNIQN